VFVEERTTAGGIRRIAYIDGLRALAVLAVVAAHIGYYGITDDTPLRHVLQEGAHGVDLFFVLSGFCLAYPTLAKVAATGSTSFDVTDYAGKRLVRIVPPFYIATALFLMLGFVAAFFGHGFGNLILPSNVGEFASPLLFLDGRVPMLNTSFWTLMVEFRWYFVFPLLLAVWVKSPRAFLAIGIASVVLFEYTRARSVDLGTLPGFMLGIIAADVHIRSHAIDRWALFLTVVSVMVALAVENGATIPSADRAFYPWPYQPTILAWQLAVFFFVVAAGATAPLARILSARSLIATGVASYSIYLIHEPLVSFIVAHFHRTMLAMAGAGIGAVAAGFAFWAVCERVFTEGTLKRPLLATITRQVRRVFDWFFLGHVIPLSRLEADSSEIWIAS